MSQTQYIVAKRNKKGELYVIDQNNKFTQLKNPVKLFTKEEIESFYKQKSSYHIDSRKHPGWFVLKTTSKKFKKLYKIEYRKNFYEKKHKVFLVEKYQYDLLLFKALKYVRKNNVK